MKSQCTEAIRTCIDKNNLQCPLRHNLLRSLTELNGFILPDIYRKNGSWTFQPTLTILALMQLCQWGPRGLLELREASAALLDTLRLASVLLAQVLVNQVDTLRPGKGASAAINIPSPPQHISIPSPYSSFFPLH